MTDAHAHLSNTSYGNADSYLEQIKGTGIEKSVIVPGGMVDVRKMTDYVTGRSLPESTRPDNEYVKKCVDENKSGFIAFVCIDPHSENSAQMLERSVKEGCRGLKLSPITHQFSFSSRAVMELADRCRFLGIPVYSHVLYSPGAATSRFVELAKKFRNVNFILGHMGFGPADQEGLQAAVSLDNFFLETSTGNFIHINESVKKAGPGKLIFGSEFPLSHPAVELEKIMRLDISDDARDKILDTNIGRILLKKSKGRSF